jgi:hypothetical protein
MGTLAAEPDVEFDFSYHGSFLGKNENEAVSNCEKLIEKMRDLFGVNVCQKEGIIAKVNGKLHMDENSVLTITIGKIEIGFHVKDVNKTIMRDSEDELLIGRKTVNPAIDPAEFD